MQIKEKNKVFGSIAGVYEANYRSIMHLIPDLEQISGSYESWPDGLPVLNLKVAEQCKYTTIIDITHLLDVDGKQIPDLFLKLRICHDARVAEVITYQNQSHFFLPMYMFPNGKLLYPLEKRRVNQFLGEWLKFCITHGYQFVPQVDALSP